MAAAAGQFEPYNNSDDLALHFAVRIAPGTVSLYAQQLPQRPVGGIRGDIVEWSAKSRMNMMRAVAEIDFAPLLDLEIERGWMPVMVTLTLPGEWLSVAPTNAAWMAHVAEFRRRYARFWGMPLIGLWKKEFQGRGAPHLHIYTCAPTGMKSLRRIGQPPVDVDFAAWCRITWAEIVAHRDPEQRRRHREHGAHVDAYEGMCASNPRRLAKYFLKHAAPGEVGAKEYQHQVPAAWHDRPGRFWGMWGLKRAVETVEISRDDFDAARRVLRRQSRTQTLRLPSGEVIHRPRLRRVRVKRGKRWRWTWRRAQLFTGGQRRGGWTMVPDGPAEAAALARWLADRHGVALPEQQWSGAWPGTVRPVHLPGLPDGLVVELVPPPRPEPPETRPVFHRRPLAAVPVPHRVERAERIATLEARRAAAEKLRMQPFLEPSAADLPGTFAQRWWADVSRYMRPSAD